ncbi:hypothetical protein EV196_1173 [Mariniflexile fucanivorans]|uniref:GldM-like protein n=1 Tax=Mariniflexile fucanivorans TaxID=264023 RepID=A0A4R1R8X4_9FLAO|nr:hypothetical protein [Mariniflexile fucanivorans]TCL62116.1 hypothetical protein EV196_1173 [Mariniflexile fucanivorans]
MKRIVLLTALALLFFSCKKDEKKLLYLDISFRTINHNNIHDINELKLQNNKIVNETNSNIINVLNELSVAYLIYLDSIQSLCKSDQTPFFYKGNRSEATKLSHEFSRKTNEFLNKLNNNIKSSTLKKRTYSLLNVDDIKIDKASSIMYVECYFRNVSCETLDFFINERKRNVLLIQKEIFDETLLNNVK